MAADEDRAERIRSLKQSRPDLTWGRIAQSVGVSERSTYDWRIKGTISHEHAIALAGVFDVDPDWMWSGRDADAPAPDLMGTLSAATQLDRIEAKLDALLERLPAVSPDVEFEQVLEDADRSSGQRGSGSAASAHDRKRKAR